MEINHTETTKKNTAIAPGLTIVYWGREDVALINAFEQAKEQINPEWQSSIWWYSTDHIHSTLSALTRTKYGQHTPLKRSQLPGSFSQIITCLSSLTPFEVVFSQLAIRPDGQIQFVSQIKDAATRENLQIIREVYKVLDPGLQFLDRPKSGDETLHVNLGYFQKSASNARSKIIEIVPVTVRVSNISIVHYLRRTLEPKYVLGQYHFPFGEPANSDIDSDYFYNILYLR